MLALHSYLCRIATPLLLLAAVLPLKSNAQGSCITKTTELSDDDFSEIYSHLESAIGASAGRGVDRTEKGDLTGGIVRLAFHDAAGFDKNADDTLGPDGCFDASNPDNAGLPEVAESLATLWGPYCSTLSLADFWVLAAKVAVEYAASATIQQTGELASSNGISIPFRYGRTTASNCNYSGPTRLPGAQTGLDEIQRVFIDQMGLTMRDAVALLGAHTLGRAEARFSGFEGKWTREPGVLTNEYFDTIVNEGWNREVQDADHTVWTRGDTIMLNADMELAYDASDFTGTRCGGVGNTLNNGGNRNQCNTNEDVSNGPYEHTVEFAGDQDAWYTVFASAMHRMSEVGYDDSALHAVGTVPETTSTAATKTTTSRTTATTTTTSITSITTTTVSTSIATTKTTKTTTTPTTLTSTTITTVTATTTSITSTTTSITTIATVTTTTTTTVTTTSSVTITTTTTSTTTSTTTTITTTATAPTPTPVTTAPSPHPTCTTKDKDSDPLHRCVFPFRYNNQLFTSCIADGLDPDEGDTWCATTADYDTDGEWGICETTVEAACPTASTPTKPAITTPSITTSTLTSPSPPPPIFTATPLPSTATPPPTTSSTTITTSTTPTPLLVTTETTIKTSETPNPPTKTTPPTSTSTAVPTNSRKTCSELGWSQIVGNVCGESDANLGGCHRGLDYNSAATVCATAGARLCSRNEIIAQTTKGTGCSFDKTNIWSSTECDGGYETMRGKNGRRRTCSSTTETGNVRCCSDVTIAAVAALASSTSVQLQGNPFTTGSSVVFAAKGVDGQTGSNAATAAAATIAIVFLLVGIAALRRPTTTATPPFDQQDNNNINNTSAVVEGETEDNNNIAAVAAPDADHENVFAECEFVVHNDVGTLQIKSVRRPNPAYRASTIIDMLDSGVGQANAATHI